MATATRSRAQTLGARIGAMPPGPERDAMIERVRDSLGPLRTRCLPIELNPKQEAFLRLRRQLALYGGAAGGGKSWALLAGAAQYVDVPGYRALIIRRTFPDLSLPGAILDVAQQWWGDDPNAHFVAARNRWDFYGGGKTGGSITFGHLTNERDKYKYQGAAFQYIAFDELTQFTRRMFVYMFSRLRRPLEWENMPRNAMGETISQVPLRMRAGSNPGGDGHDWVYNYFIDPDTRDPRGVFMPARLHDNPKLDQEAYIESLELLDPLELQQLLDGDWEAEEKGLMIERERIRMIRQGDLDVLRSTGALQKVRAWDFASTASEEADFTSGTKIERSVSTGRAVVVDQIRVQRGPGDVEKAILRTAEADTTDTTIVLEVEPGSSGVLYAENLARGLLAGYHVVLDRVTGSKPVRAKPLYSALEAGWLGVLRAPWTRTFVAEVLRFPDGVHDDQVDSAGSAWRNIGKSGQAVPRISRPAGRVPTAQHGR